MQGSSHYSSSATGEIFQRKPPYSKPSKFSPKGWTDTISGYQYEAKKLTKCLLKNRTLIRHPYNYRWAVHINLNVELPSQSVTSMWTRTCRKLRGRGLVALWVREPNRANKVHYHLIVTNNVKKRDLESMIEEAMPDRGEVKWRKRVERIRSYWFYCHYITKAKLPRYTKGRIVADFYGKKRLLFQPNLKLKKYGVIGPFWVRPKKTLWQEFIEDEKRIEEGLQDRNVRRLVKHVYDMLGQTVKMKDIRRSFGLTSDTPTVQQWIDSLLADEWADSDVP